MGILVGGFKKGIKWRFEGDYLWGFVWGF